MWSSVKTNKWNRHYQVRSACEFTTLENSMKGFIDSIWIVDAEYICAG